MRIGLPRTSREYQYYQHLVGGSYNLLLMFTGISFGNENWSLAGILALLTFIANRTSSEITYRIQRKLFEENKELFEKNKRPCGNGDCPYRFGTCPEDCTHPHGCTEDYETK